MDSVRLCLILILLGCAEPSITSPPPRPVSVGREQQSNSYSFSSIDGTVHVRITSVRSDGGEKIREFMQRMFESADAAGARRLVLDLRAVSGSDTFLLVPLLKGIIARDHFRSREGLIVIVGPDSFSPTQNAATLLGQYANPVFAR